MHDDHHSHSHDHSHSSAHAHHGSHSHGAAEPSADGAPVSAEPRKPLPPAAQRALAEAAERRAEAERLAKAVPKEFQGPSGPEPTRYGDWERKGIASDF